MPTLDSFDYSWARPDPSQMAAAGIKAVGRYLWDGGKGVTVPEIKALWAAGVGVWLGYEANSGNHLRGAAQGTIDGRAAQAILHELSEIAPSNSAVYFACDQDVTAAQMPTVIAYLNAAKAQCPGASCYAEKSVIDAWGHWAWQTYAWSGGQVSDHAALYQWQNGQNFNGSVVDYNQILNPAAAGILWPPGHTPQGGGTPLDPANPVQPIQGEDEMHLIVAGKNADGSPSGHNWIVAADLSSRTFCSDITNFEKLAAAKVNYRDDVAMSYAQLMAIPDVTDRDGKGAT